MKFLRAILFILLLSLILVLGINVVSAVIAARVAKEASPLSMLIHLASGTGVLVISRAVLERSDAIRHTSSQVLSQILGVLIVVIILTFLILIILKTPIFSWVVANNFTVSFVPVLLLFLRSVLPSALKRQTWKTLDPWLQGIGFSTCTAGLFGIIGLNDDITGDLLRIATERSQLPVNLLVTIVIVAALLGGLCEVFRRPAVGSPGHRDESHEPQYLFIPAFLFAWLGNLGGWTVVLNSMILTLVAHLLA